MSYFCITHTWSVMYVLTHQYSDIFPTARHVTFLYQTHEVSCMYWHNNIQIYFLQQDTSHFCIGHVIYHVYTDMPTFRYISYTRHISFHVMHTWSFQLVLSCTRKITEIQRTVDEMKISFACHVHEIHKFLQCKDHNNK